MDMKSMEDLRYKLCKEVDDLGRKKDLNTADLDQLHKLTDTIKNLDKIQMLEEGGYSNDGEWEAEMRGVYGHGTSHAGRRRDSRGRYARDNGRNYPRDGRTYPMDYSRDGSRMSDMIHDMMDDATTEREREALRRCADELKRM